MTEGGVTREHDRQISVLVAPSESTAMQLVNPNKVNKIHDPQDLIQLATFVQSADNYTKSVVGGKLEQISESIRHLQAQAQEVLASAKRDVELNHAKCNFKRIPGKIYHLYRRAGTGDASTPGFTYFSMLSPMEWGTRQPDTYMDSYRLEYDMSWTLKDNILEREKRRTFDSNLLGLTNGQAADAAKTFAILDH